MNKRFFITAAALLLSLNLSARAELTFDGKIEATKEVAVTAPYGGTVQSVAVRQGELINAGDPLLTLQTTKVLATEDGTVRGVFAQAGDSAEQTVLYLSPVSKYTLSCSISKAYQSIESLYVRIGETLYIRCVKDGSHKAVGTVTAVSGSGYTVCTTGGELYMEETVYLYRSPDYDATTRVGSGTVSRTPELSVSGTGSILRLHVSDGEEVERGQLLFETVQGNLDIQADISSQITAPASGIIAQITAQAGRAAAYGDTLLTFYPNDSYQARFSIPQEDLSSIQTGDPVTIRFEWQGDDSAGVKGTVREISYLAQASQTGSVVYDGYADFSYNQSVRLGMSVTVTLDQDEREE